MGRCMWAIAKQLSRIEGRKEVGKGLLSKMRNDLEIDAKEL